MAQRPSQGSGNPHWYNDFTPESSLFNTGTLNSPGVPAISSSNNNHGHFTSVNSNLFRGQGDHNVSAGPHQDHTPFSIDRGNRTNSRVQSQSQELLEFLLRDASPTKQQIQENIKKEIEQEIKEILDEIKGIKAEVRRLNDRIVEMEAGVKDLGGKLWTQLSRQQEHHQRKPVILMPYPIENNRTPHEHM